MSGLNFTLSKVTSFLPDNLSDPKKLYAGQRHSHEFSGNDQMQMVLNTEEFLEVALESWSEWDLNPRPLNSVQTLKLYIHIYMYFKYFAYIIYTETFYGETASDFVISRYLLLLPSIVILDLFLNEVASNAFKGALFWKILLPQ